MCCAQEAAAGPFADSRQHLLNGKDKVTRLHAGTETQSAEETAGKGQEEATQANGTASGGLG